MEYDVCIYENLTPNSRISNWGVLQDCRKTWQHSFSTTNQEELEKVGAKFASDIIDDLRLGTCVSNVSVFPTGKITVLIGEEIKSMGGERRLAPLYYAVAHPKANGGK